MAKIKITENELKQMIEESVYKVLNEESGETLDEGFFDNLAQGFKGAFKNDAQNVKRGVNAAASGVANTAQRAWNGVKNAGQKVANVAQGAYNNAKEGVNQRVNAFKTNYNASRNTEKINDVIKTLQDLQAEGVISGTKTNATIAELTKLLKMGAMGMRGRATQASNNVGR